MGRLSKYPEVLLYSQAIVGITTGCRERSGETFGSVGKRTVLQSFIAHRLHASLGTGLRHLAFHQHLTARYGYFVVFVSLVRVEQFYRIMPKI